MAEIEAQLRGPLGMTSVRWLSSPELALACRTGFAPGDRAGIVEALALAEKEPGVNADIPWAMAGPSGADATVRHYSHDAWNSISATIKLPNRGAVMGALAPILTPSESGERRSFVVAFPIVSQTKADRHSGNAEWAADLAEGMNEKLQPQDPRQAARGRPEGPRTGRQARPRQRPDPRLRGVHGHGSQDHAHHRVRPPPGRIGATRGIRTPATRPRPGHRVRRLHHPARHQPHPDGRRLMSSTRPRHQFGRRPAMVSRPSRGPGHGPAALGLRPRPAHHPAPGPGGEGATDVAARPAPRRRPPRTRLGAGPGAGRGLADDERSGPGVLAVHLRPRAAAHRSADGDRPALRRVVLPRPVRLGARRPGAGHQPEHLPVRQARPRQERHNQGVLHPDDAVRLPHPGAGRPQGRVRGLVSRPRRRAVRHRTRACRPGSTRWPRDRWRTAGPG